MENINSKILLVDDEPDILEFLSYNLKKDGYQIASAANGKDALEIAKTFKPDLVILDMMMPEMDGIETCKKIREIKGMSHVLIAFLTALSEDYSQIAGFQSGADDYITKPVRPKVLSSRIEALLRRKSKTSTDENAFKAGEFVIDRAKYLVIRNGEEFQLPKKEFELMALLSSRPGYVFSRNTILERIWGEDVVVGDRTIDVHIRKLREKLGENYFKTIKGIGYKFEI